MPVAAAAHVALAPAPPESPPPPVHAVGLGDALGEELEEEVEEEVELLSHVDDRVDGGAWRVDQRSIGFPSPNDSSHGYQLSRRTGSGFFNSVRKNRRPAARRLRKAIASRFCRDFMPLIHAFEI